MEGLERRHLQPVTESSHIRRYPVTRDRQIGIDMRLRLLSVTACVCAAGLVGTVGNPLDDARAVLKQWVQTRQLISKIRGDWQADKEMLEQTSQLYERELNSLEEQSSKVSTNSAQVNKEREQAEALIKSSNESLDRTRQFAASFEGKIAALIPQLPAPLQDILKPLLARLPTDPASTKMAARSACRCWLASSTSWTSSTTP